MVGERLLGNQKMEKTKRFEGSLDRTLDRKSCTTKVSENKSPSHKREGGFGKEGNGCCRLGKGTPKKKNRGGIETILRRSDAFAS